MCRRLVIIGFALACFGSPAAADDWVRPEPTSYHARGFGIVAEIFPPHARQNPGGRPLCYLYEIGHPGAEWRVEARLKWRGPPVNERMPYQAVISPAGYLITLNEHGRVGFDNAVVLYRRDGSLLNAYTLDELLPAKELSRNVTEGKIPISMSSRWWTRQAQYYFLGEPARFYIVLPWASALEFRLDDGAAAYAGVEAFPELAALRRKEAADAARGMFHSLGEEAEVWSTSLRFSSITDVLAARSGTR